MDIYNLLTFVGGLILGSLAVLIIKYRVKFNYFEDFTHSYINMRWTIVSKEGSVVENYVKTLIKYQK